jgi:hypothetical protein
LVLARLAALVVRVLLETMLLLLLMAAVCGVLAFRTGRRLVTDHPGRLDRFSAGLLPLVQAAVQLHRSLKREAERDSGPVEE